MTWELAIIAVCVALAAIEPARKIAREFGNWRHRRSIERGMK